MAQTLVDTLHDRPGEQTFEIQTGGEIVKPFLNPINQLVDECKLHVGVEDGLTVHAVDPANVGSVYIELLPQAFDEFELDDNVTYGINVAQLRQQVKRARMHNSDELVIEGYEQQLDTTVTRDSSAGAIVFENWMRTIEPDSIRQEPDLNTHPSQYELNYNSVTFDTPDILDVFQSVVNQFEYVRVWNENGDLAIKGKTDSDYFEGSAIRVKGAGTDDVMVSQFSTGYLRDMLSGIKQSKANTVTFWYGDEVPLYLEANRIVDDETIMHLMYGLAPRIQS